MFPVIKVGQLKVRTANMKLIRRHSTRHTARWGAEALAPFTDPKTSGAATSSLRTLRAATQTLV